MNPATFLRVLGPERWRVCYVEPSVRPDDSRYGENPNRLQQHTQFQARRRPTLTLVPPQSSQQCLASGRGLPPAMDAAHAVHGLCTHADRSLGGERVAPSALPGLWTPLGVKPAWSAPSPAAPMQAAPQAAEAPAC
jgi:hypothetical protein